MSGRDSLLLAVDKVSVSFDGFRALNDLTLHLVKGELRCIIGANGAGKTTLMDVITGKTRPDTGTVTFDGEDITKLSEHAIVRRGIGRKFQRPTVFPAHTVYENLELAADGDKSVFPMLLRGASKEQRRAIDESLELVGLQNERETLAGLLSHGQKQWLEIGMLLVSRPKLLFLDEPVAGMTHKEMHKTAEILLTLAGERTVVVVEHDMDFVRSIAKGTVTVLHEGRRLAEGAMKDVQADPKVIEVYLGS